MAVPPELMAALQGAVSGGPGGPGGPGGRPQESGLPGQVPEGIGREPGDLEEEIDEDPLALIADMIDLARDFIDREDIPAAGKQIMEDITSKLQSINTAEEKALGATGPQSLVSRGAAT